MSHLMVISYHYVLDGRDPLWAGLKGVSADRFDEQLDALAVRYRFLDPGELAAEPWRDGTPRCLVTFDDGTRDQAETAVPILQRHGIKAIFFVVTGTLTRGSHLAAHLLHQLLARFSPSRIADAINTEARAREIAARIDLTRPQQYYRYDDPDTASLKFQLNHALDTHITGQLMRAAFEKLVMPVATFVDQFYVRPEDAHRLESQGHYVAAHSARHFNLATLSKEDMQHDIEDAAADLSSVGLIRGARHFAIPFGGPGTFNGAVLDTLRANGFEYIYTGRASLNEGARDLIDRFGTKQLPPFVETWPVCH